MRKLISLIAFALFCIGANAQFYSAPAFPGAEGFGRYTTGGRGGKILHVTNLNDYCDNVKFGEKVSDKSPEAQGTLRHAIRQQGARTIVFDVAGTIELVCPLKLNNDSITILGQTAPGDGICLKNYTLGINANNVIVRYIRCRMGDELKTEDDAMNATQKPGNEKHDIIIDHCSLSWSTDECGSFYGNKDFTLQWCILSESLRQSVHDKGKHGYGGIWGGESASFHHNLLAHHDSRNPRFDHGYLSTLAGPVDYVNNIVYNWGQNSTYGGENRVGNEPKKFNMIANYYKPGPYTLAHSKKVNQLLQPTTSCSNCNPQNKDEVVPGQFYAKGNIVNGKSADLFESSVSFDKNFDYTKFQQQCILTSQAKSSDYDFSKYSTISTHDAKTAYEKVLAYAGAGDIIDDDVINDVEEGIAKYCGSKTQAEGFIDTQEDVKTPGRPSAWPILTGSKVIDTDRDGIPDEWEKAHKLNPNDASDALTYTLDKKGYYTNLEVYANSLVEKDIKEGRKDAKGAFKEYYPNI